MSLLTFNAGLATARAAHIYYGRGYFSGLAPDPTDPDGVDGRFRKLNEPARGRIVLIERSSMRIVATTLSAPDGTWEIGGIAADRYYMVLGFDDTGAQNAAVQDWVKPALPE